VFTALVVDADDESASVLREALADAGCLDIECAASSELHSFTSESAAPDLIVLCARGSQVGTVQRVASTLREVPILAVCDEGDIDLAFVAGAAECVTRPLRRRELVGRIREAMRGRSEARRRAYRERKMSDRIVSLQREKQDLERLVCVDALTGVANRRHALGMLAAEWKRAARENMPVAVVMIDLDCYHAYNERYGHLGGDQCLARVADAMVRCLRRPSDYLGRYGGEEFIAVLPNTDAVGAKIVAERLRAAVEALAIPHEASVCGHVVTITAGFASLKVLADDSEDLLIAAADSALLRAKAQGRNRVGGEAPLVRPSRISAQRWQRYTPVYVDPWFADRIPSYLDSVHEEARGQLETLRSGERRGATALARLRQGANHIGLTELERQIARVESAARDGELAEMRDAAEALVQYVTHVQIIYRRPNEAAAVMAS